MITVYGIPNCDTVQRALRALDAAGIAYRFHDFKREGLSRERAQAWIDALGVDTVVNRRGTTWRKLDERTRNGLTPATAADLLVREPALVKRPVIEHGVAISVGFAKTEETAIVERLRQGVAHR